MPVQTDAQQIQLDAKGLFTNPNDLSKVPPGSFAIANNVVIDRDGIVEQRRGFKAYGATTGVSNIDSGFVYQNRLIWHYSSTFIRDSDGSGTAWTTYAGSFAIPTGAFAVNSVQAQKNIYFTTASGIQKLDSITGTLKTAGVPIGLDGSAATTGSGWFTNNTQVAYRVLFGYIDANNNTILGAPSERIIVTNTSGGATNTNVTFTLPTGLTTSYFYQLYRSPLSVDQNTVPTDELQLVLQVNLVAGDISAGTITVTDTVPDNLKGTTIYTAASQQGIAQANNQPPVALDVTLFKNFVFYANTVGKQKIPLTMLAAGSNGDTITIGGVVFTGQATENASIGQYQIFTSGTAAVNIDNTSRSLVRVINTYANSTTVYGLYVSGFNDLPGQILLQERNIGGSTFTISVSRSSAWFFNSATSSNDTFVARVFISKFKQPEAVPAVNFIDIGSADKKISRIIALRNSVFIFKDDGVFRITGDDLSSFAVTPWDSTVILRSPRAAILLNNQIYCFTTQGIIAVSETGSAIVSRPIEKTLLGISASQYTNFDSATFGIGYESDRKYLLNTITSTSDTVSTQSFIYNYITNTHTKWLFPYNISAGVLNPTDNKLYVASADSASQFIYQERKMFTTTDYADDEYAITITGSSGTSVTVNSTTNILAGFTLSQGANTSVITSITDSTHLVVTDIVAWQNASAIAYKPISINLQYTPIHGGNPTVTKLFQEVLLYFGNPTFKKVTLSFASNFATSSIVQNITLTPLSLDLYGEGSYGEGTYGGGGRTTQPLRTWVPLDKCRSHWIVLGITKSEALTIFALDGVSVFLKTMGYRFH